MVEGHYQQQAIEELNKLAVFIQEYESDTFSASGSEVTESEVWQIVARLIDQVTGCEKVWLDGVQIDAILSEIREQEEEDDEPAN